MLRIFLDNVGLDVPENLTILQVCMLFGIDLPRFCYHERLSIAGNCRMCLVETSVSKKLVIACATPVLDKMVIWINSLRVKKAREGVLEFLLSNHPLDCPICDQGGECDLQDLTFIYGSDRGRFYELSKRSVSGKNFGLLIKTYMTRCIHCTRCVRFLYEVCGFSELGVIGRGVNMEISNYIDRWLEHELSANIIDLCPVGALTSKSFAFVGRSWECLSIEFFDLLDGFCSPIRIDIIGNKVVRILPVINNNLFGEWISNKIRFFYDSLYLQRVLFPLFNFSYFFSDFRIFCSVDWKFVFKFLGFLFFKRISRLNLFFGTFFDFLSLVKIREFFLELGCHLSSVLNLDFRFFFVRYFLFSLLNLFFSFCIVGFNLRLESPLLSSKIRHLFFNRNIKVFLFGLGLSYTYFSFLSCVVLNSFVSFLRVVENLAIRFFLLDRSLFIFGVSFFLISHYCNLWVFFLFFFLFNIRWICVYYSFIFLHLFELGLFFFSYLGLFSFVNDLSLYFFFGYDGVWNFMNVERSVVVYQGSHGDFVANFSTLILPVKTVFETSGSFLNTFGLWVKSYQTFDLGLGVLTDVELLYNVLEFFRVSEFFVFPLQFRLNFFSLVGRLYLLSVLKFIDFNPKFSFFSFFGFFGFFFNTLFFSSVFNYYLTDFFCRSSRILLECSVQFRRQIFYFGL